MNENEYKSKMTEMVSIYEWTKPLICENIRKQYTVSRSWIWNSHTDFVPWMFKRKNFLLLWHCNVCVNLCCCNWAVTEYFLYVAYINIFFKKQGCEGVTEHMGSYMHRTAWKRCILIDNFPHRLLCQAFVQLIDKVISRFFYFVSKSSKIIRKNFQHIGIFNLYNPLFLSFAENFYGVIWQIHCCRRKWAYFRYSCSCCKQHFQYGYVT